MTEPLTLEQFNELEDGTEVEIRWSGGNFGHYTVWVDHYGARRVMAHKDYATVKDGFKAGQTFQAYDLMAGNSHAIGKHPLTEIRVVEPA